LFDHVKHLRMPNGRSGTGLDMQFDDLSAWARTDGLEIVLLVLGAILLGRAITAVARLVEARLRITGDDLATSVRTDRAKHVYAVVQAAQRLATALVWFMAGYMVLQRCNVPNSVLVGPATAAGVALGLGSQRFVGDLVAGFFLISERQYGVGDIVEVSPPGTTGGVIGTVEEVTLRVTRLRTPSGDLLAIPNGEIRQLSNRSKDWSRAVVDVPVPSSELDRATEELVAVAAELRTDERWRRLLLSEPQFLGVESVSMPEVELRLAVQTLPGRQWEVGRELRRRSLLRLQEAGIIEAAA
jgi:moderate conductance mechanosensitive channel